VRIWTDRQVLTLTLVVTLFVTALLLLTTRGDWVVALFMVPLVASAAFWSLRISRGLAGRLERRYGPPPPPPPPQPAQPTSERPEHAQRRRQRRRQRGRRESGG
jgi:hypothetical protein